MTTLEATVSNDAIDVIENTVEDIKFFYKVKKGIYYGFKRLFDILISIIGIVFLIPITIIVKIISVCNKDFAPIFFTQQRIGKNGKEFKLYKFRSMIPNADEVLFKYLDENEEAAREYKINKKLKNDPRITRVGRFLRNSSMDELPQLLNVLKGDMTLIGNRPYLPREKDDMGMYYDDIVKTKPGLTGLWQTSGRSKTTFEQRLKLESYYSNNCNIKMDIKIFFLTIIKVIKRDGAK